MRRSRTCSGRTRRCSTSSSTCSSGRATRRSSSSRSRGPSCSSGGRPGAPASATSRRSTSSRSRAEAMEELLAGLVPGLPGELRDADPRAGRGRPALRGRDRADAARPRRARPGGRRLPADRRRSSRSRCPETLHALIAARLDGLAADGAAGASRTRAVLGKTFTQQALAALSGLPEAELEPLLASLVRKEVLRRPGRPALARARPVRLPPGPRAPGRLRDAVEARPEGAAPGRRRVPRAALAERARSSRSSPRTTSTPTRRRRTPTTRRRSGRRPASSSPAPASAPRRSARPRRRSATSRRRRSSTDDPVERGRRCSSGPAGWPGRAGEGRRGARRSSSRRSRSSRPRG